MDLRIQLDNDEDLEFGLLKELGECHPAVRGALAAALRRAPNLERLLLHEWHAHAMEDVLVFGGSVSASEGRKGPGTATVEVKGQWKELKRGDEGGGWLEYARDCGNAG